MMARRLVTALVIALLISGFFTYWVSRKINHAHGTAPPTRQRFLVAARAIRSGESLRPESLSLTESPSSIPIPGSFTRMDDVTGRAVLYPLSQGEPVLERYLATAGSGSGLTVSIPPGMRAISLKSDEVMGVSGFLLPGTFIDLLATYHTGSDPEPVTATILQDVKVIAAGQQIQPDPDGKPSTVSVVTLLLRAEDADKAVMASSQGSIHFVLRNGADRAQLPDMPISVLQLAQQGRRPRASSLAVATTTSPRQKEYVVETYLGDKRVANRFD